MFCARPGLLGGDGLGHVLLDGLVISCGFCSLFGPS